MDFSWTEEDTSFQNELETFLQAEIPSWWRGMWHSGDRGWDYARAFCKKLGSNGWLTMAWPKEYGGADAPIWTQVIFKEAMAKYGEPRGSQYMNLNWIGPSIMLFGSEDQKKLYLSKISAGDVEWCQGFSEPDSGSDLASLQCRAERDGDDFIINGQKIWTSYARRAEYVFLLTRTDQEAPKHKGISVFLIDMKTPGITIRTIKSMGGDVHLNEVFYDNVRVPRSCMLGEENQGWGVVTTALNFERIGQPRYQQAWWDLKRVMEYAKETQADQRGTLSKDPILRQRIADVYVRYRVARALNYRLASLVAQDVLPGPAASSLTRIHNSTITQHATELAMEVTGLYGRIAEEDSGAAPFDGLVESAWRDGISSTIAAGTLEVQKEQLAVRGLGLPR